MTNVFKYAAACEAAGEKMTKEMYGYERKTTFYSDLSIAECYGVNAIKDTYKRVVKEWMNNIEYITEFAICLNHKSWEHHARHNDNLVNLYVELWYEIRDKIYEHYDGNQDALDYFFEVAY